MATCNSSHHSARRLGWTTSRMNFPCENFGSSRVFKEARRRSVTLDTANLWSIFIFTKPLNKTTFALGINLRNLYVPKILFPLYLQSLNHSPTSQIRDPHFWIVILGAVNFWSTFANRRVWSSHALLLDFRGGPHPRHPWHYDQRQW